MVPLLTSRSNFKEISAFKIVKTILRRLFRIHVKICMKETKMGTRAIGTIKIPTNVDNMTTGIKIILSVGLSLLRLELNQEHLIVVA